MTKLFLLGFIFLSMPTFGFVFTGNGEYSLMPYVQHNPDFSRGEGSAQWTRQSFRLLGQFKLSDQLDFNTEVKLFDDLGSSLWGAGASPHSCKPIEDGEAGLPTGSNQGDQKNCSNRYPDPAGSYLKTYVPKISKAYLQYGFDYCLLTAGRRPRDLGRGILYDSGKDPFELEASIFDGATCHVNLQKYQTIAFKFGFDKIHETSQPSVDIDQLKDDDLFSSSNDIEQFFFSMMLDTTKNNAFFSRKIGFYFSYGMGTATHQEGTERIETSIDVKILDLYTLMFFNKVAWENELVFRLGKSADPSWAKFGGVENNTQNPSKKSELNAFGVSGDISYVFGGPEKVSDLHGDTPPENYHLLGLEYAYAPGDADGYLPRTTRYEDNLTDTSALAFHRNYKPLLVLFRDESPLYTRNVDGIFDAHRFMNATMLAFHYTYQPSVQHQWKTKIAKVDLNESISDQAKALYPDIKPIGFYGTDLGLEWDIQYQYTVDSFLSFGLGTGVLFPGSGLQYDAQKEPSMSYVFQGSMDVKF